MVPDSSSVTPRESLKRELDALFAKTRAKLGAEDLRHIRKIANFSLFFEVIGRGLIHFSFEPFAFSLGVIVLAIHKQLEVTELGHNIQHGTYENIPGAEKFRRKNYWLRFHSRVPVHAPSWRFSHNHLHHGLTNVVGKDPDARLYMRNNKSGETRWYHKLLPLETLINWPNILANANFAATGVFESYVRKEKDLEILPDKSWKSIFEAHKKAFAGSFLYTVREYLFFPLLAGTNYPKILLGNFLSSLLRNLFTAPALYAAHISPEVETYTRDTRASDRAHWYEMQIRTTQNFEVPYFASLLVGGLDYQIEHHLCSKLPPNRLREIAPQVREICERHGLKYMSYPWYKIVRLVFKQIRNLSHV